MYPKVSILTLSYNHEKFIAKTIESFLMQKTKFAFEILIHDDASIDGTAEIIKQYEKKHPKLIKPIYQEENQYSKGVGVSVKYQFPRATGEYIAICEGDDYWTDPYKLQKQVDFLEANPDYGMCSHKVNIQINNSILPDNLAKYDHPNELTFKTILNSNYIRTPSVVFKTHLIKDIKFPKPPYFGDHFTWLHILRNSKGMMLNDVMGVYRKHNSGSWNGLNEEHRKKNWIQHYSALFHAFKKTEKKKIVLKNLIRFNYNFLKTLLKQGQITEFIKYLFLSLKLYF